jgi:phosphate transport system permease protein
MTLAATRPKRVAVAARTYPLACGLAAVVFAAVAIAVVVSIGAQSWEAWSHSGVGFLWSGTWDPASERYGGGLLIVGTLVTTAVAMAMAMPVGLGIAVYLVEIAPTRVGRIISAAIELLAAVPSIVVGLWALLVLSPVFAHYVEPALGHLPGFGGAAYGPGVLLAAVVLATMTLPTVVALSRNAVAGVDATAREGARALGATRWQTVRFAVLPAARRGIAAAVTLAIGRAMGESIAVAMVIGNRPSIPHSLLAPGATIGSAIVNQFAEAQPGLDTSSIIGLAAILLLLTVIVNAGGVALLRGRADRRPEYPPLGPPVEAGVPALTATGLPKGPEVSHGVTALAARSLPRRRRTSAVVDVACTLLTVLGLVPLVALVGFTVARGWHDLSLSFFTHAPTPPGIPGGGISTAITGSARIVGLATLMAVPVGLFAALLLFEHAGPLAAGLRFVADVITGVPSIVIGIFAYAVLVEPLHHPSTTAAAFSLAVLMVPIMIRGNEEAFRSLPLDLWEAGIALGAPRSAVARRVIVRESLAPVVSANLLAISRGVGETAPLLFTVAAPTAAMTLFIFDQGNQPYADAQNAAWATALTLLLLVLALSATSRFVAGRLNR